MPFVVPKNEFLDVTEFLKLDSLMILRIEDFRDFMRKDGSFIVEFRRNDDKFWPCLDVYSF